MRIGAEGRPRRFSIVLKPMHARLIRSYSPLFCRSRTFDMDWSLKCDGLDDKCLPHIHTIHTCNLNRSERHANGMHCCGRDEGTTGVVHSCKISIASNRVHWTWCTSISDATMLPAVLHSVVVPGLVVDPAHHPTRLFLVSEISP